MIGICFLLTNDKTVRFPEGSDSFAEFAASPGGAEFGLKKNEEPGIVSVSLGRRLNLHEVSGEGLPLHTPAH